MTSIKLKYRPSAIEGREGSLYYQVICDSTIRKLSTSYKLLPEEWDSENEEVLCNPLSCRANYVEAVRQSTSHEMHRFRTLAQDLLTARQPCTVEYLLDEYRKRSSSITLFGYMRQLIARYRRQGQYRTSDTYATTLRSFIRFRTDIDVCLEDVDSELMESYERHLRQCDLSPNTVSFYMKRMRAVYKRAVDDGLIDKDSKPFRRVSVAGERTSKRALPLKALRRLKALDLSHNPQRQFARDMFLFSFYTRGMSFVDIAYLQKRNLRDGVLSYRRKKTNQLLEIRWEPCMQDILKRYAADTQSPYLLSIIRVVDSNHRRRYLTAQNFINRHLKEIGKALGLRRPLTMYCARHSWASIAHEKQIPISVISEGMGHESERTTQIYLASLRNEVIDRANRKLLKLL